MKIQVSSLKSQVSSLKSQVSSLKSQVSSLKSQVSSLKSQVPRLVLYLVVSFPLFFLGCHKDIIQQTPDKTLTDSKSGINKEMSQDWFEQKFGSTLNIQGKSTLPTSAVTDGSVGMNMAMTVTPLWNAAQISSYLQTNPIVIVPVAPIPALDSMDCGYGLIFFRDSLQQINTRLQVYVSSSRNLSQPDNVSNFTGFYWQINTDGSIEKVLWLKNGRFTGTYKPSDGRTIATSRNCDDDDSGPDCPSAAGGRRRGVIRVVLDAIGGGITWVWNGITNAGSGSTTGGSNNTGSSTSGFNLGGNMSGYLGLGYNDGWGNTTGPTTSGGGSSGSLNSEIDNTLFDLTGGTEKIRYYQDLYMLQMGFADTEFEDLYYNRKLFTSIEVYFSAVGRSAVTAAAIKNNMSTVLADMDLFGYYMRFLALNANVFANERNAGFPSNTIFSLRKFISAGFTVQDVADMYSNPQMANQIGNFLL